MDKITERLSGFLEITNGRMDRERVYRDFVHFSALAISNTFDLVHYKKRTEEMKTLLKPYNEQEISKFYYFLGEMNTRYDADVRAGYFPDRLGEIYEHNFKIQTGGDLTPAGVAHVLNGIVQHEAIEKVKKQGFYCMNEPTCGSGAIILSAAEKLGKKGFDPAINLVVLASDINLRCVHAAYVQLSLYGIPAVVLHGDIISVEEYGRWFTPLYILNDWAWRSPLALTTKRDSDTERLKYILDPRYMIIRELEHIMNKQQDTEKALETKNRME